MGATTTPAVERPMFLSADKRKISYRSKNGNTFTIELKNSKAADSPRDSLKKSANDEKTLVVKKDGTVDNKTNVRNTIWDGVYDTIAMMIEESLEIACFGPYDEPAK